MVAKCANPSCNVPFRYLSEGRLFRFETAVGKYELLLALCRVCFQNVAEVCRGEKSRRRGSVGWERASVACLAALSAIRSTG